MTTGGSRRHGAALALALPTAGLAAGRGGQPEAQGDAPETRPSANSPSPSATSPGQLCAQIIVHWSRPAPTGDSYGTHRPMPLPDGQYEALRRSRKGEPTGGP
ncbi:hypothetical protein [Streptomyces sp. SD31]|uniref:hypothetical protein n=1 Tax=Streptomyces sp. SD31 TaxID=3452208 RepID=UPI003F8AD250